MQRHISHFSHFLKAAPLVLVSCVTFDADNYERSNTEGSPDSTDEPSEDEKDGVDDKQSPKDKGSLTPNDPSTGGDASSDGAGGLLSILDPLTTGGQADPGPDDEPPSSGGMTSEDPPAAGGASSTDPDPVSECPDICTGGCDGDVCKILCAEKLCNEKKVQCPPTHNCELECFESACTKTELKCDQQECRIQCRNKSCKALHFVCQNATCELFCGAEDSCQDATMNCSEGAACTTYVDCDASTPAVSCDNSSCEMAGCEDD